MIIKYKLMLLALGVAEHTSMVTGSNFPGLLNSPINIMAKELAPIILSCALWSRLISKKRVEFKCDNHSLVDVTKKGSSKEDIVMHLLRCPLVCYAVFDIHVTVSHIPVVLNTLADLLSRERFLLMHPQAS